MYDCPRCGRELIWQNDYDFAEESDDTFSDYVCDCGVSITVPWRDMSEDK